MFNEDGFDDIFRAFEEGLIKKEEELKMTKELTMTELLKQFEEANEEYLNRKAEIEDLRSNIKQSMDDIGLDTIKTDYATFSITAGYEAVSVDRKKLEKEFPRVFNQVKKSNKVKETLAVKKVK